jgi:hypothetical protein
MGPDRIGGPIMPKRIITVIAVVLSPGFKLYEAWLTD